jgi:hypothetical protein
MEKDTSKYVESSNTNQRITGTGNEIYNVKGYYKKYTTKFPINYNTETGEYTYEAASCEGLVITGGDSRFIDAYKSQIPLQDELAVINLNYDFYTNPTTLLSSSTKEMIVDSSISRPVTLSIRLDMFPERGNVPCDYYGIKILYASNN